MILIKHDAAWIFNIITTSILFFLLLSHIHIIQPTRPPIMAADPTRGHMRKTKIEEKRYGITCIVLVLLLYIQRKQQKLT